MKVLLEKGHEQVLSRAALLEQFAAQCGQAGAMGWMQHFLQVPNFRGKEPYLALVVSPDAQAESLQLKDLRGTVFLFEYRPLGIPTRLFCTDDLSGFRTIIAPPGERHRTAALAVDSLLKAGAQYVLFSYDSTGYPLSQLQLQCGRLADWAQRTQTMAMSLALEPTLEKTLAKLGKSTRFNMGYYRRRIAIELPCDFIDDVRGMLRDDELDALNQGSLNVVSNEEFRLRYKSSCELPGGFLVGLRSQDGRWVSLIGGWRQEGVAVLLWQMNLAGYERLSIGTAMRSFYLENESRLGMKTLAFYHGTPHLIHRSFDNFTVQDLFVRRRSLPAKALMGLAKFVQTRFKLDRNNQFFLALTATHWTWKSVTVGPPGDGTEDPEALSG